MSTPLPTPQVGIPTGPTPTVDHAPTAVDVDGHRYHLWVLDVGLACCAVEFVAASMARDELERLGAEPFADAEHADVVVVSGTVTDKLAPAVRALYDSVPGPKHVISFGACSNSGGPYWDSYSVTKGVDQLVPVDVWVPGCPPRPEALIDGLETVHRKVIGAAP